MELLRLEDPVVESDVVDDSVKGAPRRSHLDGKLALDEERIVPGDGTVRDEAPVDEELEPLPRRAEGSREMVPARIEIAGRARVPVQAGISTSFGCPFEGDVPLARLEWVVRALVDMGAGAIGIADTTGMANPRQVTRTFEHLMPRFPGVEWTIHTHDTRAMAIPNILAAMEMGVTTIDASIGGLGGCPFAPGASGNVCSEDLVHCLHAMGIETGIDLDRLLGVSRRVQSIVAPSLFHHLYVGEWMAASAARSPARS